MEDRGVSLIQIGMGSQFMKQELESHTQKITHTYRFLLEYQPSES